MQRNTKFFTGFLMTLICTLSMSANAGDILNYEKTFTSQALPGTLNYIVLNLYETETDWMPVASQTFYPGEWQITGASTVKVSNVNVSHLNNYEKLWAETEINGEIIGQREPLLMVEPGISVGGTIESRIAGFKYPDATIQITAGVTPRDLSTHAANSSAHHSPLVTTTEIVDGTILPADLNQSEQFIFKGMTNTGGDINFRDTNHAMRWMDATGANQRAFQQVYSTWWSFVHNLYSDRYVLYSDVNGIGIGTSAPTGTHAVTMPSLNVTGNHEIGGNLEIGGYLEIGLERVTSIFNVSTYTANCHITYDSTCYYGNGSTQCPVGMRVLSGGTWATDVAYGAITRSYPDSTTSWLCSVTSNYSRTTNCWALCARLQ